MNESGDGSVEAESEAFEEREAGGRGGWGRASYDGESDGARIENGEGRWGLALCMHY